MREFNVGSTVWFSSSKINTAPSVENIQKFLKGKIDHIDPVHGTMCLVSFEIQGETYQSTITTKSLWPTKKSIEEYSKSLNDFLPGDLVYVALNYYDRNRGTYTGLKTFSGIVLKASRQTPFMQIQTESGVQTAHRDFCIVLSRTSTEESNGITV